MATYGPVGRIGGRRLLAVLALVVAIVVAPVEAEPAAAQSATIVVDSTDDRADADPNDGRCRTSAGTCSLRAAISHANGTNGPNTINFAIPGSGVKTIAIGSSLPTINDSTGPLTIDGYSQPGATPNTAAAGSNAQIMIEVAGTNSIDPMIEVRTPANIIKGLALYGARVVILVEGEEADGNRILGNFVGTNSNATYENPIGVTGGDTGVGISLRLGASQNVIGTPELADRNVISGNGGYAMRLNHGSTHENLIQNNVVGLRPALDGRLRQVHGIDLQWWTWGNLIGGYEEGEGNLVGGMQGRPGLELSHAATGNHVVGNLVGTLGDGNSVASYTGSTYGIGLKDDPRDNYIAHNVVGGNVYGIWAKHNYNTGNMFVDNRVGVGVDGAPIPNTTANVFMSGVEEIWHGNVIVGRDQGQISVTNFLANRASFYRPETTGRNRITQGQFIPGLVNQALTGQATQSSTGFSGNPGRAIDGNTNGNYNAGSVTHTNNQANAWWEVDLGATTSIAELVLHNRTDCCAGRLSNFSVFVSQQPFGNRSYDQLLTADGVWSTTVGSLSGSSLTLRPAIDGRYVRVQLAGSGYLSLAEVQIFGNGSAPTAFPAIDIAPDGLDPNDAGDGDNGIQSKLNHPQITGIGPGKVFGTACASCTVEVYVSGPLTAEGIIDTAGSEPGVGLAWIGSAQVDGSGAFSLADSRIAPGRTLSATAVDGANNTSELPPGIRVPDTHSGTDGSAATPAQPFAPPTPPAMPRRYDYGDESTVAGRVIDLADAGVAGIRIDLFEEGRQGWLAATVTDSAGDYRFPVSAGCYVLTFIAPADAEFSTGQFHNREICVAADQQATVNATLRINGSGEPTTLGGTVDNSAGDPVDDVEVTLFVSDESRARLSFVEATTTDGQGRFLFGTLDAGCYIATLRAPTDQTFVESGTGWLNLFGCVAQGAAGTVGPATVDVPGSTDAVVGGTLSDPAGVVAGLQLDLFTASGDGSRGAYVASAASGADGTFTFGVNAGCYVVTYIATEGRAWVDSGSQWLERPVCVDSNESNLTLNAQLA